MGPLVEGLVVAAVAAAGGATIDEVVAEAGGALAGKAGQLGEAPDAGAAGVPVDDGLVGTFTVENPHGLHARPAARLVHEVRHRDARVLLRNVRTDSEWVDATSLSKIAT